MPVTIRDVEHVIKLARLQFDEEEKGRLTRDLNRILDYVEKLNELDTSDVEPTSHVLPLSNVFREDVVTPSTPRDLLLSNAPSTERGFFKVPKVIE
ncbi:MAG: Asp-tRNA(Asn)/Glu-tRNA(Gln) amidotransferase subunit GatC [Candidatus Latescibacteria bacterium]|nr:Asp-tRNA(Asn)/Glu-tRNA(Gln) amidotransferase subunit GatC [Candidatus Latescibacterota bacterium]